MDWRAWLFRALWLVALIVLSFGLLTTEAAEATEGMMSEEMSFGVSKTVHILAFTSMTVLLAFSRWPLAVAWGGVGFLIAYAGLTEYLQTLIPGRTGTVRDVALDCSGILLGLLLTYWLWWRRPAVQLAVGREKGSPA
jgi:VanZ family protein